MQGLMKEGLLGESSKEGEHEGFKTEAGGGRQDAEESPGNNLPHPEKRCKIDPSQILYSAEARMLGSRAVRALAG